MELGELHRGELLGFVGHLLDSTRRHVARGLPAVRRRDGPICSPQSARQVAVLKATESLASVPGGADE